MIAIINNIAWEDFSAGKNGKSWYFLAETK
jgi:hypothetical protein